MKNKALESFESAKLLGSGDEMHYCMAIQCAYYGGLQMAMAIIMAGEKCNAEGLYAVYKNEKSKVSGAGGGSHVFYINKLFEFIRTATGNPVIASKYKNRLNELKVARTEAAYRESGAQKSDVESAIKKATTFIDNLPGYIKLLETK